MRLCRRELLCCTRRQRRYAETSAARIQKLSSNTAFLEEAELQLGLFEVEPTMWVKHKNGAVKLGRAIESHVNARLASKERYLLWERFREDTEKVLQSMPGGSDARLLVMGGVAQGMATVDGDLDLIIYDSKRIAEYASPNTQRSRTLIKGILQKLSRALLGRGVEAHFISARVPIIQYRPKPEIEQLFGLPGIDRVARCLMLRDPEGEATPHQTLLLQLQKLFPSVTMRTNSSPGLGPAFLFSCAADAYSAMFQFPRKFVLPHVAEMENLVRDRKQPSVAHVPDVVAAFKRLSVACGNPVPTDAAQIPTKSTSPPVCKVPYPFAVDISVAVHANPWGPRNSELLRRYLSSDKALQVLAVFVKWWSKRSLPVAINNAKSGWLHSYAMLVLLVHWLLRTKRVQWIDPESIAPITKPDLRYPKHRALMDHECAQVVRDFASFCEYYASGFNYDTEVVTLLAKDGAQKKRTECTPEVLSASNADWIIEDPYENRSLGHAITAQMVVQARASFMSGARHALRSVNPRTRASDHLAEVLRRTGAGASVMQKVFGLGGGQLQKKHCPLCNRKVMRESNGLCAACSENAKEGYPVDWFAKAAELRQA